MYAIELDINLNEGFLGLVFFLLFSVFALGFSLFPCSFTFFLHEALKFI